MPEAGYSSYETAMGFNRCDELVMFTETGRVVPIGTLEGAEIAMVIPAASSDGCEMDADGFVFGSTDGGGVLGTREAGTGIAFDGVCEGKGGVGVWYPTASGPFETMGPLPPLGRHAVRTRQLVQSKVIVPKTDWATVLP